MKKSGGHGSSGKAGPTSTPKVMKDAKSTNKYSTDGCGRSCPPSIGKKHKSHTNP